MTGAETPHWEHLRAAGSSLLVHLDARGLLTVEHWGADLGELDDRAVAELVRARRPQRTHSSVDQPRLVGLLPQPESAYPGRPAVQGHHSAPRPAPYFRSWSLDGAGNRVVAVSTDPEAGLRAECALQVDPAGVVLLDYAISNTGDSPFVIRVAPPEPADAFPCDGDSRPHRTLVPRAPAAAALAAAGSLGPGVTARAHRP